MSERNFGELGEITDVKTFNLVFPVGTLVRYYPVVGVDKYRETETQTPAWELYSGHPVVSIKGQAGGVSLRHLRVASR